jgi:alpha-1,2-mannosyltransferase
MLPTVLATAVLGYRRRRFALTVVSAAGLALMVWTPITLLPEHHETAASLWRQLAGGSYLWWALAVIAVAGASVPAAVGADGIIVEVHPNPDEAICELSNLQAKQSASLGFWGGVPVDSSPNRPPATLTY